MTDLNAPTAHRHPYGNRLYVCMLSLCLLVCALVLVLPRHALAAETTTPETVRVGYFYNGDFMYKNADGSYAGYDVEYYYTIAGYTGWNIQFVDYGSLNECLAGLEAGDIDIASGMSKTTDRENRFIFAAQKMCTSNISVQTRSDDTRFTPGDAATMTDITCGILKGSNVVTLYANWCGANGLTPHVIEYDSIPLRNAAFASGEVDAIAAGSTLPGAQKVAEFPALDLYFMFNKGATDRKAQLDRAMGILSLADSTYAINLFQKYFPNSRNTTPTFSNKEKAYLAQHQTLKVAVLKNDAPFSRQDSDGKVTGILPEYFDHLGQVIGVQFQCVGYASKDDACAALAAGEVDIVGKFEHDIFDANDRKVLLSSTYLQMDMVQITRAGTETVNRAAVPECNAASTEATFEKNGSSIALTSYANGRSCFSALKSGSVDAVICPQVTATWLLDRNRASDYVVSSFGTDTWDACCVTSYGDDGNTLRLILDKTIAVDGNYIGQLITSDTLQDSADLASVFDRIPVSVLAFVTVLFLAMLAICIIALVTIVRRRGRERELARQKAEADRREMELAAEERMNAAKQDFFGTVSHDMRTPLNGIVGFTALALKSDDGEEVRGYLDKIRSSSEILSELVNDTLVMSRIESEKIVLNLTPNDTYELLEGVCSPIRAAAEKKGVTFVDDTRRVRRRTIMVDRLSMQKIFLNLLANAVKFTPAGGTVRLGIELEPAAGDGPDTVLTVADTGIGISDEFLPKIYEPFTQENPNDAGSMGTGLGLPIVKRLVEVMGGTIDVHSEKGKGTTFTVRLHFEEVAPAADNEPSADDADGKASGTLAGRKVLVSEDNALNLEILRTILEEEGMDVVCTTDGRQGLEVFENSAEGEFSAVLLDLRMPVMDGLEAARAIRALDREDARKVLILAVSADAYSDDISKCTEAGMDGHVAKPIDPGMLLDALKRGIRP